MTIKTLVLAASAAAFLVPASAYAQHSNHNQPPAPTDVAVDFGVLPIAPLGPAPCLQTGAIGGPADPCSYKLHHLTPEEVTVAKGGQATFQIHGGGHGFAIYQVSKKTTRDDIGQYLCPGVDPSTQPTPTLLNCNLSPTNPNAMHEVKDAKGDVVLVAQTNVTNAHPDNRVWSEPGRLASAGAQQFLNGGTIPAGATSNGQLISYRFLKTGRYLIICMNRTHFLNDWMFGFVNVVDGDDDSDQ